VARFLLIRHAESEGNRDQVFTATPLVGLTERGREQARAAAAWIRARHAPTQVVSSPFARARQTADILAEALDLPIVVEDDLRERDYGTLAGQAYATPRVDYDRERYWLWRPAGGETLEEVLVRVGATLDRLAARADHDEELVVVSHGAVMMAMQKHVTGAWPAAGQVLRNAGILLVEHGNGVYRGARELSTGEKGPLG
jgi:probable phosphoglycerate mutase